MSTISLLTKFWHLNWLTLGIAIGLILFQIITRRGNSVKKNLLFCIGILLLMISTISPLAYLGRGYLFSAHMIEHIILLLVVPPLLLSGINPVLPEKLHKSGFKKIGDFLFIPAVSWILGIGTMYIWHVPAIFDTMKRSPLLHGIHIISLLLLGIIFIWPVYAPIPWKKLSPLQSVLYLFIACVGCTILGIMITFAPANLFIHSFHGNNPLVWKLVRNSWGIDSIADQQAGGLIMWVPACIIYITNILIILGGYYNQRNIDKEEVQI